MRTGTEKANLLDLAEQNPAVRSVFERHGISWLLDTADGDEDGQFIENAAAISGLSPAELQIQVQQAIERTAARPMTRRLIWRDAGS